MEFIAYLLLAALGIFVLFLFWCGSELVKMEKNNPENIIVPSVEEIKFTSTLTKWEVNHALHQAYKTDKKLAKMRRNYGRIIYS